MIGRPLAAIIFVAWAASAYADPLLVTLTNASRPTACAEEDNIYLKLSGERVGALRIEATFPAYLSSTATDSTAPDFRHCDMSGDPAYPFTPQSWTLFDDGAAKLVGHTFASNWRPNIVPVSVGDLRIDGLHLLQLFRRHQGRWIELLVLYPADGYWRVKPLPPSHLVETAYGSSFLIGPIEQAGRPVVDLARVDIEPAAGRFHLFFSRGGTALLQLESADPGRATLAVRFDPPIDSSHPFAALRSMFVSPDVADASEVTWRENANSPWRSEPIMAFTSATVESVRFGRRLVAHHNTSAPDLTFADFARR